MKTCDTCKHWGAGQEFPYSQYIPAPVCEEPESPDYMMGRGEQRPADCKECGCPDLVDIDRAERGYLEVNRDGFGLDYPVCSLVTGPKFFCPHHSVKSPDPPQ